MIVCNLSHVQDVVGFSTEAHGPRLAVRLMHSLLLLGLLRFYRFGFAVGTAQVPFTRTVVFLTSCCTLLHVLCGWYKGSTPTPLVLFSACFSKA